MCAHLCPPLPVEPSSYIRADKAGLTRLWSHQRQRKVSEYRIAARLANQNGRGLACWVSSVLILILLAKGQTRTTPKAGKTQLLHPHCQAPTELQACKSAHQNAAMQQRSNRSSPPHNTAQFHAHPRTYAICWPRKLFACFVCSPAAVSWSHVVFRLVFFFYYLSLNRSRLFEAFGPAAAEKH